MIFNPLTHPLTRYFPDPSLKRQIRCLKKGALPINRSQTPEIAMWRLLKRVRRGWSRVPIERVAAGLPDGFRRARVSPFGLRGDARGRCRSRRERIAKPATPRPVLRPLEKARRQRFRTRRHLPGLPRTEHPSQPAGGLRRRILGAVGSTRWRSARRRTGCVAAAPPAAHDAQDSRWLQDSADSVAWAAHGMPESPHEISRPG